MTNIKTCRKYMFDLQRSYELLPYVESFGWPHINPEFQNTCYLMSNPAAHQIWFSFS
jgi:hypothetical protein